MALQNFVTYDRHVGLLFPQRVVYRDELKILDLTLAALEDAIEEAGNTRRGRALKRQAEKIRGAIARREGKG